MGMFMARPVGRLESKDILGFRSLQCKFRLLFCFVFFHFVPSVSQSNSISTFYTLALYPLPVVTSSCYYTFPCRTTVAVWILTLLLLLYNNNKKYLKKKIVMTPMLAAASTLGTTGHRLLSRLLNFAPFFFFFFNLSYLTANLTTFQVAVTTRGPRCTALACPENGRHGGFERGPC